MCHFVRREGNSKTKPSLTTFERVIWWHICIKLARIICGQVMDGEKEEGTDDYKELNDKLIGLSIKNGPAGMFECSSNCISFSCI